MISFRLTFRLTDSNNTNEIRSRSNSILKISDLRDIYSHFFNKNMFWNFSIDAIFAEKIRM